MPQSSNNTNHNLLDQRISRPWLVAYGELDLGLTQKRGRVNSVNEIPTKYIAV